MVTLVLSSERLQLANIGLDGGEALVEEVNLQLQ